MSLMDRLTGAECLLWTGDVSGEVGTLRYLDNERSGFYEIIRKGRTLCGDLAVYGVLRLPCVLDMRTAARMEELLNAARRPEARKTGHPDGWNEHTVCDERECAYFRMGYLHVHTPDQWNGYSAKPSVVAPNAPPLADIASGLSAQQVCPPECRTALGSVSGFFPIGVGVMHFQHHSPSYGVSMRSDDHLLIMRPAGEQPPPLPRTAAP